VCLGPVGSGNPPVSFPIDGTIGADYVRRLLSTSVRSPVRIRTAGVGIIRLARNEPMGRPDVFDDKDDVRRVSRPKFGRRGIYNPALFGRDEGEVLGIKDDVVSSY
jgi:hypothetical protein